MTVKSKNGAQTAVLRKLGSNEKFQIAMCVLDQYRGTILSCRYAIPPRFASAQSQAQLEAMFKIAVVDLITRHPMLQVGLANVTSKSPSWLQLQSLDLSQHIHWLYIGQDDNFEQTVKETFRMQLDDRFPQVTLKQPGWKITVIRQEDAPIMEVLLTFNHPQFDGAGARILHEDLLEMLNRGENGSRERTGLDGNILTLPEASPMLPIPIESLHSLPLDLGFLLEALWEDNRPKFINWDATYATWCPIRSTPYKTQFRCFYVDNASLHTILTLCRRNNTTITALLNGLALIAFSSRLDSTVAPAFQCSTIIDHRRNLPPAPTDAPWARSDRVVCNYVTQKPHRFGKTLVARIRSKLPGATDASSESGTDLSADLLTELWAISAQNRQEIVDKLGTGLRNDLVGLFNWVPDWLQMMRDMAKKRRQFSWLVTNIGVLDGGKNSVSDGLGGGDAGDQSWSIDRAQFGLSAEIPAAAIEFAPVSVSGGALCVSAQWADCAVDVKFGERIMADMERWMAQLARQS